jgi:hypothetical protein
MKDHLVNLVGPRRAKGGPDRDGSLQVCMLEGLGSDHERFFTASEKAAVVMLPSINSPANFDTALVVDDPWYAGRLVEHGQALYGGREFTTAVAIQELTVPG